MPDRRPWLAKTWVSLASFLSISLFIIYKFWQNCASVRQVSDLILKTVGDWNVNRADDVNHGHWVWWTRGVVLYSLNTSDLLTHNYDLLTHDFIIKTYLSHNHDLLTCSYDLCIAKLWLTNCSVLPNHPSARPRYVKSCFGRIKILLSYRNCVCYLSESSQNGHSNRCREKG